MHVSPLVPGLRCTPRTVLSPTGAGHSPTSQEPRPPDLPELSVWEAGWHTHGDHQGALLGHRGSCRGSL